MRLSPRVAAHRLAVTLEILDEKLECGRIDAAVALLALARADAAELASLPAPGDRSAQVSTQRRPMLRVVSSRD